MIIIHESKWQPAYNLQGKRIMIQTVTYKKKLTDNKTFTFRKAMVKKAN